MASTPFGSHIYSAANFNVIKNVQKQLITQVCAGVDDQLNSLVSGEEGELWYTWYKCHICLKRLMFSTFCLLLLL